MTPSPTPELTAERLGQILRQIDAIGWLPGSTARDLLAEIDRLNTQVLARDDALYAALSTYGNHHSGCTSLTFQDSGRCSCGLSALLDRRGPQEPANGDVR